MGLQSCIALAILFLAGADPSRAQSSSSPDAATTASSEPAGPVMPAKLKYYDVHHDLELNCTQSEAGATYVWKKNGTAVESWADLGKRLVAKDAVLRLTRTTEDDYGNYTCGVSGVGDVVRAWEVHARPVAKLQPNVYVVEGQKLRVTCRLIGKPYVPVEWRLRNGSEADNSSVPALDVLGERGAVRASEQGVEGAELLVEPVERSDGGDYICVPLASNGVSAETTLRVKDKRAALWPFLGICAEVFVLCAIILVYEKRRTKPELDDSDTDNHEQKKS